MNKKNRGMGITFCPHGRCHLNLGNTLVHLDQDEFWALVGDGVPDCQTAEDAPLFLSSLEVIKNMISKIKHPFE